MGLSEDRAIGMNVTGWAVFPDAGFSRYTCWGDWAFGWL